MLVIEPVGQGREPLVELVIAGFVPADQQDCRSSRVEGVEHAHRPPATLNAKLAHVAVARARHFGRVRKQKPGSVLREQLDYGGDVLLFAFRKPGLPVPELVRILDVPSHQAMYSFSGMMSRPRQHPGELTGVRVAALWSLRKNGDLASFEKRGIRWPRPLRRRRPR